MSSVTYPSEALLVTPQGVLPLDPPLTTKRNKEPKELKGQIEWRPLGLPTCSILPDEVWHVSSSGWEAGSLPDAPLAISKGHHRDPGCI